MSSAAWDLQQAVHATLAADSSVLALLGSARVYDDVPQGAAFPYLALASHHLVNLRHESSDARRERDRDTYHISSRFRAVLEPTA